MRSFRLIFQGIVFLLIIVVGIYFGSENASSIRIVFLGNLLAPMPVWLVVLMSFFIGAVLSGLYFSFELIRLVFENRGLKKRFGGAMHDSHLPPISKTGGSPFSGLGTSGRSTSAPFSTPTYTNRPFGGSNTAGPSGKLP